MTDEKDNEPPVPSVDLIHILNSAQSAVTKKQHITNALLHISEFYYVTLLMILDPQRDSVRIKQRLDALGKIFKLFT